MEGQAGHNKFQGIFTQPATTIKRATTVTIIWFLGNFLMFSLLSDNFKQSVFQEDLIIPNITIVAMFFLVLYNWRICLSKKKV